MKLKILRKKNSPVLKISTTSYQKIFSFFKKVYSRVIKNIKSFAYL